MLKILVAPAGYKGTVAAHNLAAAIAQGCEDFLRSDIQYLYGDFEIVQAPIADGGDDSLSAIEAVLGGELIESEVIGPTGRTVRAGYLEIDLDGRQTAIVELARASGIAYLKEGELAPLSAHTYGTGQLIDRAIANGAKKIIIMVGGSASTDGGTGALAALGARFLDKGGQPVPLGGGWLSDIVRIDLTDLLKKISGVEFVVATDVTSPLTGKDGAAAVFGPQKGATADNVKTLDRGLAHLAMLVQAATPLDLLPGAGAAGGAGFGFSSVLGAEIVSGFHYLSELLGLPRKLDWCDLVCVAEGRLDNQSLTGKGVGELIHMAVERAKGVIALPACSAIGEEELIILTGGKTILLRPVARGAAPATIADVRSAAAEALAQYLQRFYAG